MVHQNGGSAPRFTKLVEELRGAPPNTTLVKLKKYPPYYALHTFSLNWYILHFIFLSSIAIVRK
jgi:hypothetical protein